METCRICAQPTIGEWLEFGPQALRNRFLRSRDESEYTHQLAVGVCSSCGMGQLASPPPACELRPRFDWISYNEPEQHLDLVASRIAQLPGMTGRSVVAGLSYKDDSTLE